MSTRATAAIELLLQLINAAGPVSAAIRRAQAEGRPLSREELDAAFAQDDVARDSLEAAITRAGG
jgi:hypothetical protein